MRPRSRRQSRVWCCRSQPTLYRQTAGLVTIVLGVSEDGYWAYWDSNYEWLGADFVPDNELFRNTMLAEGLTPTRIDSLAASGYVMFKAAPDLVVDRFYGDAIRR